MKKGKGFDPSFLTPLNVQRPAGDKFWPENDEVGPLPARDPLGVVPPNQGSLTTPIKGGGGIKGGKF